MRGFIRCVAVLSGARRLVRFHRGPETQSGAIRRRPPVAPERTTASRRVHDGRRRGRPGPDAARPRREAGRRGERSAGRDVSATSALVFGVLRSFLWLANLKNG